MAHLFLLEMLLWLTGDHGPGMDPAGLEGETEEGTEEETDRGPMMDPAG